MRPLPAATASDLSQEVVQLLSVCFVWVSGVTLYSVEAEDVLCQHKQSLFAAGAAEATSVIAIVTTIPFGIPEASLDRLASHLVTLLRFRLFHFFPLSVK